jgi:di/tricarboxylate transporter
MHGNNGAGTGRPAAQLSNRRMGHLWYAGGGTVVLLILATIALDRPGTIYKGSVTEVHGLCASGIGALAQAFSAQAQSNCGQASAVYDFLTWGRILVLVGGIALFVKIWRMGRQESAQPPAPPEGSAWPYVPPGGSAG